MLNISTDLNIAAWLYVMLVIYISICKIVVSGQPLTTGNVYFRKNTHYEKILLCSGNIIGLLII
jgi:hypothetical protein